MLIVTEAPIDALSLVTIYKDKLLGDKCILALGMESLKKFLESYSNVNKIVLAVDNDAPARHGMEIHVESNLIK